MFWGWLTGVGTRRDAKNAHFPHVPLEGGLAFFQPVELGRQPAGLAVQFVHLPLVFGLLISLALVLVLKQFGEIFWACFFQRYSRLGCTPYSEAS